MDKIVFKRFEESIIDQIKAHKGTEFIDRDSLKGNRREFIIDVNYFFNARISLYAGDEVEAEAMVKNNGFELHPKYGEVIEVSPVEVYVQTDGEYTDDEYKDYYGDGGQYKKVTVLSLREVKPIEEEKDVVPRRKKDADDYLKLKAGITKEDLEKHGVESIEIR